jgi:hypothetical protein
MFIVLSNAIEDVIRPQFRNLTERTAELNRNLTKRTAELNANNIKELFSQIQYTLSIPGNEIEINRIIFRFVNAGVDLCNTEPDDYNEIAHFMFKFSNICIILAGGTIESARELYDVNTMKIIKYAYSKYGLLQFSREIDKSKIVFIILMFNSIFKNIVFETYNKKIRKTSNIREIEFGYYSNKLFNITKKINNKFLNNIKIKKYNTNVHDNIKQVILYFYAISNNINRYFSPAAAAAAAAPTNRQSIHSAVAAAASVAVSRKKKGRRSSTRRDAENTRKRRRSSIISNLSAVAARSASPTRKKQRISPQKTRKRKFSELYVKNFSI